MPYIWYPSDGATSAKQTLAFGAGSDLSIPFTRYGGNASIAGQTFRFVLAETPDDEPLIDEDVTVSNAGTGALSLDVAAAASLEIPSGDYYWEIRRSDSGHNQIVAHGRAAIVGNPLANGEAPDPADWTAAWAQISGVPAILSAITALVTAADKLIYFSGADTPALTTITSLGRSILAAATQSDARTAIDAAAASHTHAQSDITNLITDLAAKAPLDSPPFTGTPTAPTASLGNNTTQIATTAFVSAAVAALVNSSPSTLDTLNELAAALGDDPNFAVTITTAVGLKANSASPTLTGTATVSLIATSHATIASVGTSTGTSAGTSLNYAGQTGGNTTIATTGTGGVGGAITQTTGAGGTANSATTSSTGGASGAGTWRTGTGGASSAAGALSRGGASGTAQFGSGAGGSASGSTTNTGGASGIARLSTGAGGSATATGSQTATGGAAATATLAGGTGGPVSVVDGDGTAGTAGAASVTGGTGGSATSTGTGDAIATRGAHVLITGGQGGSASGTSESGAVTAGVGGDVVIRGGTGGIATIDGEAGSNEASGAVKLFGAAVVMAQQFSAPATPEIDGLDETVSLYFLRGEDGEYLYAKTSNGTVRRVQLVVP